MFDDFERMLIFGTRGRDEFFAGGCLSAFPGRWMYPVPRPLRRRGADAAGGTAIDCE